uniref:Uncharacterized protein n=1 Tax=virus sp. ctJLD79 TaxID=2827987 RepID=A0A8S5RF58_9VIRU|nr:MAG TPA: Protein of unknown function (DUF983) [virus sp. ctJLD79]
MMLKLHLRIATRPQWELFFLMSKYTNCDFRPFLKRYSRCELCGDGR